MGAPIASQSHSGETTESTHEVSMRIDALWLATLQRVCARAAHEVKGALNGVAVNVEVVRSRAEKPGGELASVRPFAAAAATQVEALIALNESLLALARAVPEPVELAPVVRRLEGVLAPAARADGGELAVSGALEALGATSANGNAVRLAVASVLLAALDASARVRCVAEGSDVVRIESVDGAAFTVAGDVVAAVADARIHVSADASAVSLRFPR